MVDPDRTESLQRLVTQALVSTQRGQIQWKAGLSDDFNWSGPHVSMRLWRAPSGGAAFSLLNEQGVEVATLRDAYSLGFAENKTSPEPDRLRRLVRAEREPAYRPPLPIVRGRHRAPPFDRRACSSGSIGYPSRRSDRFGESEAPKQTEPPP